MRKGKSAAAGARGEGWSAHAVEKEMGKRKKIPPRAFIPRVKHMPILPAELPGTTG